jgi:hypothetical protein
MRTLTALQLAIFFALVGTVVAIFVPAFLGDLHASRLAEPLGGLRHLSAQAAMQAAGAPPSDAYPDSAPRTPAQVPVGKGVVDPEGTWSHPTWRLLSFQQKGPHYFSFEFLSERSQVGAHFFARAFGDLDGDGELSQFEVFGETRLGKEPLAYPVRIFREVE